MIEIKRVKVYVGIGANLNHPAQQVEKAISNLSADPVIMHVKRSSLYYSKPWGGIEDQPDFVNAVLECETSLAPLPFLDLLQRYEKQQGRVRKGARWGPRIIDLDLLLYGDQIIQLPRLIVPHEHLLTRDFVLYPLYEVNPHLILPNGQAIVTYLRHLPFKKTREVNV